MRHLPKVERGEKYPKKWGHELWIDNNENYCGKLLVFNKGSKFSMHYHMKKIETWYVVSGELECILINPENAEKITRHLKEGDIIKINPGQPHRLIALEDSNVFEISTEHFEEDSYRVEPGDSQF